MSRRLLQRAFTACEQLCSGTVLGRVGARLFRFTHDDLTRAARADQQKRNVGQLALRNTALKSGSGGRQSVSGVVATVFGCTGFLGRYVVSSIGEAGGRAVCPHRCDDMDIQHLRPMGDLGNIITLEDFSIRDDQKIRDCIGKSNVVINLIGQNTETWNYKFKEVRVFTVLL